jgi:hypothetical protein
MLKDLVTYRGTASCRLACLRYLLDLAAAHPSRSVRSDALAAVMALPSGGTDQFAAVISDHAVSCLRSLGLPRPTESLVAKYKKYGGKVDEENAVPGVVEVKTEPQDVGDEEAVEGRVAGYDASILSSVCWTEDLVKNASGLVFALVPKRPELLSK